MSLRRRGLLIVISTVTLGILGVGALAWTLVGGTLQRLAALHAEQDVHDVIGALMADAGRRTATAAVALNLDPLAGAMTAGLPLDPDLQQRLLDITGSDAMIWRPEGGEPEVIAGELTATAVIAPSIVQPYRLVSDGDVLWVSARMAFRIAGTDGQLNFRRYLDVAYVDDLRAITQADLGFVPAAPGEVALSDLSPASVRERVTVRDSEVRAALRGDDGTVVATIVTGINADLDETTRDLVVVSALVLVVGGVAAGGLTLRLFDNLILRRVARLSALVADADGPDRPAVTLPGSDELSELAGRIETALQRLEQAQADLARQGRELVEANAAKDRFISFLSHEFRTPLTALAGWAETLEVHGDRIDADRRREITTRMVRQVGVLDDMVDDVLLLSRTSAGEPLTAEPEDVEVVPLLADVAADLAPRIPVGIDIEVANAVDGLRARVDRSHLYRIVANYLINAAKYGAPPIRLTAARAEEDHHVRISVVDHGAGVPPEFRDALFAEFTQADPRVGSYAGVGLGLAIVAHLAAANGGTVGYAPNEPTGSRFWVDLPAA
jgi:signal transduction histidine kinase